MADPRLTRRLKWLLLLRFAVILLALTALLSVEGARTVTLHPQPYWTLSGACLFSLLYLFWVRAGVGLRELGVLLVAVDVLFASLLVYFTGFDKMFGLLYFGMVVAAAILFGTRGAMITASFSTVTFCGITLLYFFAFSSSSPRPIRLPGVEDSLRAAYSSDYSSRLPYLALFTVSLHVVAFLSGRLSEEMSRIRILNDEILRSMAGGVIAVDRGGNVAFINPQATELLGISDTRIVGRPYREVLPAPVADLTGEGLREGRRLQREISGGTEGGGREIVVSPLREDRTRELRGVIIIANDITIRRRLEEAQERAERFRGLLEMSAGMAHEVRNPLASIRGAAQELKGSPQSSPEERQLLQVVMRESDRLDKIIADFLEYAGDRPLDMGITDLSQILREVILLVRAREDLDQVRIEDDLPAEALCNGDENQLKQLFLNLVLNAVEACEGRGTVLIRCAPRPSLVPEDPRPGFLVEVIDDGPGIPPEDLPKLFDPFFTSKPQGTGMGLAIARKIVLSHEGTIELVNREKRGVICRVGLPS